jgi:copper(I)-binding protein
MRDLGVRTMADPAACHADDRQETVRETTSGWALVGVVVVLALVAGACGNGSGIEIEEPWGRPIPNVATAGAFFMTIVNNGDKADQITAGSSPACGTIEFHESFINSEGAAAMRPVEGGAIDVPAGGEAVLQPGGLHVMCIGKLEDFTEGAQLPLTLQFQNAGDVAIVVEIGEP